MCPAHSFWCAMYARIGVLQVSVSSTPYLVCVWRHAEHTVYGVLGTLFFTVKALASLDLNYYIVCLYSCSLTLAVKTNMQFTLAVLPPNCSRCDLSMTKIQNFSGGACPQTPLATSVARELSPAYHFILEFYTLLHGRPTSKELAPALVQGERCGFAAT